MTYLVQPGVEVGDRRVEEIDMCQGAEQLLGALALGLGRDQQLGGEVAHRGQFEPAEAVGQVRAQHPAVRRRSLPRPRLVRARGGRSAPTAA